METGTPAEKTNKVKLNEGEQLDDLQCVGLYILQKKGTFRYGTDAVLLANYAVDNILSSATVKGRLAKTGAGVKPVKFIDVGTGTGIVPILMCGKLTAAGGNAAFTAVEIQPEMCELARRSIDINGQQESITVVEADIRQSGLEAGSFDIVTINPPYVRSGSGILSDVSGIACARHEIYCTQEEMIGAAVKLLKFRGMLFMVNRPDRLTDALLALREGGAEPDELTFVHAFPDKPPVMFLLRARKGGGRGLRVKAPVILEE